jgi:hypothetical protein
MTRMQWLTLWDELRGYFASSRENTRWSPSELVALMDAREKTALRALVNGEETVGDYLNGDTQ